MKLSLISLAAITIVSLGCTKKATPDFEASVHEWSKSMCACFESAPNAKCEKEQPEVELSAIERLFANAGALTDQRRETVDSARRTITTCAERAQARHKQQEIDRETRALMQEVREEASAKKDRRGLRDRK